MSIRPRAVLVSESIPGISPPSKVAASALRGLGTVAMVVALGAALGMAIDVVWVLPAAVRWAVWSAWLASAVAMLAFRVVGPLTRRAEGTS